MPRPAQSTILQVGSACELSPPLTDSSDGGSQQDALAPTGTSATSAQLSTTKLVPLLPKPLPSPILKRPAVQTVVQAPGHKSIRRCRVKLCPIPNCALRSHRLYTPYRGGKAKAPGTREIGWNDDSVEQLGTIREPQRDHIAKLLVNGGGVDGLPALPLDLSDSPICKELFHVFFSFEYERIERILKPPPFTKTDKLAAEQLKQHLLGLALSTPVHCLQFISSAHHQTLYKRGYSPSHQMTSVLYGKVTAHLRDKLDNLQHDEIADLLLVICTLVMFDAAIGRTQSLTFHRDAVHHLIRRCGNMESLGRYMQVVMALDRNLSIFTCEPPIYMPPQNHLIRKASAAPQSYGSYFEIPSTHRILGDDVYQYCNDVCRTIEIMEFESITFNPLDPPIRNSVNLPYFFFLRDCAVNDFVRLNVLFAKEQSLRRCVLYTVKIVEYMTVMDNYFVTLPMYLAGKIRAIICRLDVEIKWEHHQPLLTWILFTLACMAESWDGRQWALESLRTGLELKYGGSIWAKDWRQYELNNLRRFAWSDSRFSESFVKICNDLRQLQSRGSTDGPTLVES